MEWLSGGILEFQFAEFGGGEHVNILVENLWSGSN
jgi:hypothetical protein